MDKKREFYDCLLNTAPVLKESQTFYMSMQREGIVGLRRQFRFQNSSCTQQKDLDAPYVTFVREFLEKESNRKKSTLFLVSDREKTAVKAATCLWNMKRNIEKETSEENKMYDYDEDDEYAQELEEFERADDTEEIYFSDIVADLKEQENSEQEEPWVLSTQIRDDAEVLILKEITLSYYEKLAEMLLQQTGYRLEKELSLKELVNRIYARIGDEIDEECIAWFLDKAAEESQDSRKILRPGDFRQLDLNKPSAISRLQTMTGLKDMKRMALEYQAIFAEQLRNPKLRKLHNNMIFYGNPGTGKTTCGEIMAQLLLENGVSNGVFVSCSRKDLIGKYVGHTAAMVAEKFEKARNGILFVDEAGFFLNQGAGEFVYEAIKEFVRFMEQYPDVTVIFAMYEKEVKGFLELDEGLTSRISGMLHFPDYSVQELWQIAVKMAEDKGYILESSRCFDSFARYIINAQKKEGFGNARTVRKLTESAIIAACVRHMNEGKKKSSGMYLTGRDIEAGIERMNEQSKTGTPARTIGFMPEVMINYTANPQGMM